jgi:predicted signal transduction protein with EAL and GGDEF domain
VARREDTVARFGGDEFTVLCPGADAEFAVRIAERFLKELGRPFVHDGQEVHLGASVGVRVSDHAGADPDGLLRDADIALYQAKQRGRARVELYNSESQVAARDPLAVDQDLRVALRHGELGLHYQPIFDLSNRQVIALEALIRWEHPTLGNVPPSEFIPIAEESGLIVTLGDWILAEACRQLAIWRVDRTVDASVQMAVNVSPRQLDCPEFVAVVDSALAASGLEPQALCLEITESAILRDSDVAQTSLRVLAERGISLALDDFGVGFSSLSHIREFRGLQAIKVDRSFVAGLGNDESDGAIVQAVLGLAKALELVAVAEGVETEDQLERLCELECNFAQGYLFARPHRPEEIEVLLRGGNVSKLAG